MSNNPHDSNTHPNPRLLMTHTSGSLAGLQRHNPRQFRDNFSNVIREIQPLVATARSVNAGVQNAISMTHFLHRSPEPVQTPPAPDSFVINLDIQQNNAPNDQNADSTRNNNTEETNGVERTQTIVDAQQFLQVVLKYLPFVLILLAKAVYDYYGSILILAILFTTFAHTNSAIKKETTKRDRRSLTTLFVQLLYIVACFVFVQNVLHKFNILSHLVLIRTFSEPLTMGKLLWIVVITDFGLKLVTISVKILLTMLPGRVVPFQKRGKVYLFVEATSQMYRSIATIQPWLHYLLESYQGPEKIVAVFLSAFYMISKGSDLMSHMKLLKTSFFKLLQNVTVGSSPSKEQIQTAGEHCPICHDEYDSPVLLQCRHIFCENCVTTWFDREQTCPLCRAKIVDDPSWRDGSTSYFIQLY